ncbi:MAG: DUF423 domain-containing protein [Bacteroidia bacterium]|nr:DUF423 domain-containing protein [Bacteroidia bacterium]
MQKTFLEAGVVFAGLSVILGAFGSHILKEKISLENIAVFETGVRYQFYHALALLIAGVLAEKIDPGLVKYAGMFFIAGILLFSGSIYLLSLREVLGIESWKMILGPLTPLGGLCFISGWLFFLLAVIRK